MLSIYLKDNIEEVRKLLLIIINKFYRIEYYQKLKSISNKAKMNEYKEEILKVLNSEDKQKFGIIVHNLDISNKKN